MRDRHREKPQSCLGPNPRFYCKHRLRVRAKIATEAYTHMPLHGSSCL